VIWLTFLWAAYAPITYPAVRQSIEGKYTALTATSGHPDSINHELQKD